MNKIMEKEWFNGFVANGLQFRLDGSMINDFGVTYHIGVKNISGHLVEIEDRVYFRFDYKNNSSLKFEIMAKQLYVASQRVL